MNLNEVKPGNCVKVVSISASGAMKRRMLDMGLIKGSELSVIKVAPLGDPMEVSLKGYNLTLRKEEARHITVEGK